jgi:hypothetical protein
MYTTKNFKSKKGFKQAVDAWNLFASVEQGSVKPTDPRPVTYFQPGPFGGNEPQNGVLTFEGPHYPAPHKWYAQAIAKDGVIVKVK